MNTNSHKSKALDHLSAVQEHSIRLTDEWNAARPDAANVKYLTASIGRGLKLAEIHATLHIGAQLERLADRLADDDVLDFLRPADRPSMIGSDYAPTYADLVRKREPVCGFHERPMPCAECAS